VNRTNEDVWWELLSISNTNDWNVYVNEMLEHGCSFTMLVRSHAKAQPAVEVVVEEEEAQIEVERIPAIIEHMEREDEEVVLVVNYVDDSNEEGDPVPAEWR
jgi:hypothetical protein